MLHDIGIFLTDAPGIHCHGTAPYIAHGYLGADLLRRERYSEDVARVAERHKLGADRRMRSRRNICLFPPTGRICPTHSSNA